MGDVGGDASQHVPSIHRKKFRSGFGRQADSTRSSAPAFSLQSGSRSDHVYPGKSFESVMLGKTSPGAIYKVQTSTGKQALSDVRTAPAFAWSSKGERPCNVRPPPLASPRHPRT